jgi:hypothetical protein
MSPTSFVRLAKAEPQFRSTYVHLAQWARRHRGWRLLDPGILAKDIPEVDELTLADALHRAVQHGYFRLKYTVLTPAGNLAYQIYDSPRQIPSRLPDRFEEYFNTREYPIVAVLQPVEEVRG